MKNIKLLFLAFLFCNFHAPFTPNEEPKSLEIGAAAPDFNLKGTDNKMYSLKSFAASKVLVIVFTCNHCPTAQTYEERIKQLATDYTSKGVQIVAISPNDPLSVRLDEMGYTDLGDSFEDMQARAKSHNFNFPYLYDGANQEVSNKYGPAATPHVFIFDKSRILRYSGRIDDVEKPTGKPTHFDTRNAIEALIAEKPVDLAKTKTFGCSIKWAEKRALATKEKDEWAKETVTLEPINDEGVKTLLKNKSDKLILINVWATWCGCCVTELPDFVEINRMYRRRDFEFITITTDKLDKKDRALKTLTRLQASSKNYIYSDNDVYKLIELVDPEWQGALPYTLLIEPNGKVVYRTQGSIIPLEMKQMIVDNPFIQRVY